MELEMDPEWLKGSTPVNDNEPDFPEWIDEMTDELRAQMSSWGWDPCRAYDPHPEAPLSLAQAVCLPELGGELFLGVEVSIPSPVISVKTLRGAIEREELAVVRPNAKNLYVTRTAIKEWMTACQNSRKDRTSSSESPATTKQASSPTAAPGSSSTTESKLRQDAVSAMLRKLR